MTAEQRIVRALAEAQALERALARTLTAHLAATPGGEYRDLLERHLEETSAHERRLSERLSELGAEPDAVEVAAGAVRAVIGRLLAVARLPLDLLRGAGDEARLLADARDDAAAEALEIAGYDALEALADAAGDAETAALAREHRAQEEAMLAALRERIPQLARDVLAADDDAAAPAADQAAPEAVEAARRVAEEVRAAMAERKPAAPIDDYDALTVAELLPKLRLLTTAELERVEAYERAHRNRKRVLERVAQLRRSAGRRATVRRR